MMGSPRFLPEMNRNRFNPYMVIIQRQRPPPPFPMNRPPQPERESQSSHPTSGPFAGQHSRPPPSESSRKSICGSGHQTTTKFANYWDWTCGKMLSLLWSTPRTPILQWVRTRTPGSIWWRLWVRIPKGPFLYYVRVFLAFSRPPTHPCKE